MTWMLAVYQFPRCIYDHFVHLREFNIGPPSAVRTSISVHLHSLGQATCMEHSAAFCDEGHSPWSLKAWSPQNIELGAAWPWLETDVSGFLTKSLLCQLIFVATRWMHFTWLKEYIVFATHNIYNARLDPSSYWKTLGCCCDMQVRVNKITWAPAALVTYLLNVVSNNLFMGKGHFLQPWCSWLCRMLYSKDFYLNGNYMILILTIRKKAEPNLPFNNKIIASI